MSAVIVKHGRRKGQPRDENICNLPAMVKGEGMVAKGCSSAPSGVQDLRQVTIMSKDDWNRIQMQLNKRNLEEERIRKVQEEKDRLRNLSRDQIANWTNTIKGQRQKKLEARAIREAEEEEARKIVDIDEAKFQAQKRKEAIERAKTQQYYQTDRLKGFHGALILTEVLKEREAQLELKLLQESARSGQDKEWLKKARKDYEEGILQDQEQARKEIIKMKKTAEFQKSQMKDHIEVHEKEKKEDIVEGEELKRLAIQYESERKRLDAIRRNEGETLMADNVSQIGQVKRMREIHQQQEEEENDECRIFAAAKRKMMKLRAEKEKELHNEKQQRLEMIRKKLHAQMVQKLDDEDDRIRRATEDAEAKRTQEEQVKQDWNARMQKEMVEHRHAQLEEQERKAREERRKELEMLAVRREAETAFQCNEEEKDRQRHEEKKSLQKVHIEQIDELVKVKDGAREKQLGQDHLNKELLTQEEKQFQEYADKVITHCSKAGRNVYPLKKAAQEGAGGGRGPAFPGKGGVRPSYMVADQSGVQMPCYQRGTTDEVKCQIYGNGQTDKRLGFVW